MNSSWHGCCKFNTFYQIHANKMSWVHHRSTDQSYSYYWYYKQMHTDCYDTQNYGWHVFYPMRSNIRWKEFLTCAIEFQHLWLLCSAFRPGLLLSKKPYMVAKSKVTSWVQHRSKPLMTTATTTDTCLVHQTEAQSNPCTVGLRYVWPIQVYNARTITCVRTKIMVNNTLWTKMFA